MSTRERYREDVERAYEVQSRAGVEVRFVIRPEIVEIYDDKYY
jgi:hypothetical protein